MPLSRMQKLTLIYMGKRYRENSRERVTLASISTYQGNHYDRELFDGNLRISLSRLVARGLLTQIPHGKAVKTPSYRLTEAGVKLALKLLDDGDKNSHNPPRFFT